MSKVHTTIAALSVALTLASADAQRTTIKFWTNMVASKAAFEKEIAEFEKLNPGINVELTVTGGTQYTQTFDLAHKSGNAPDVFTMNFDGVTGGLKQLVDNGWIAPINRWATRTYQATFPAGSFAEGANVLDGKIYSVPWEAKAPNNIQLYVNTKVFKDAGLVDAKGNALLPKTWDDVRKYARQITQKSNNRVYGWGFGARQGDYAITLQSFPVRFSGATCANYACFNYRTGQYEFDNASWRAWFSHWFDLIEDKSIYPQSAVINDEQARVLFAEGRFGMYIGGNWVPGSLAQTNPNFNDYTVTQLPTRDGRVRSYVYYGPGGSRVAISPQSKNQDAAWKFFSFINSKDSAMRWTSYGESARIYPESAENLKGVAADVAKLATQNVRLQPSFNSLRPQLADVKQKGVTPNLPFYILAAFQGQLKRADVPTALRNLEKAMNDELERAVDEARRGGAKVTLTDFRFGSWNPLVNQNTAK